jgi:hypothetical protein
MKPKTKKPQKPQQRVSKKHLYAMGIVGFGFLAIFGKFIIAAGIMSIIGFTSGKVVKRLQERREASCQC